MEKLKRREPNLNYLALDEIQVEEISSTSIVDFKNNLSVSIEKDNIEILN